MNVDDGLHQSPRCSNALREPLCTPRLCVLLALLFPLLFSFCRLSAASCQLLQLNRTYSKSSGLLLIPRSGGEIQFANFPGSTTRPVINDCTNFSSAGLGSHSCLRLSQASAVKTSPFTLMLCPAKLPMAR